MLHEQILLIRDENAFGSIYNELKLSFDKLAVTVRDIITERVYQEVEKYNNKAMNYEHALVQPKPDEVRLNLLTKIKRKQVDPQK